MKRTILLFIDGLGWGIPDPGRNPQYSYGGELFRLPAVDSAAGGTVALPLGGLGRPIDAVLGVPGVPQSATGQTTLLTGVNAQAHLGKHLTGFPNPILREIIREHSVLRSFARAGLRARFLNAYRPRFFDLPRERQFQFSATTVANLAADLPFYRLEDISAGRAVYQEFTNEELRSRGFEVEPMTPQQAGRILGRAAARNDFTLFEYFQTDRAGHSAEPDRCHAELEKLEEFLRAALETIGEFVADDFLLAVSSDHGNLEDISTRRHTLNPVPLLAWGPGAAELLAQVKSLDEVTPALLARHGR